MTYSILKPAWQINFAKRVFLYLPLNRLIEDWLQQYKVKKEL